jgi:hypothetical protein
VTRRIQSFKETTVAPYNAPSNSLQARNPATGGRLLLYVPVALAVVVFSRRPI